MHYPHALAWGKESHDSCDDEPGEAEESGGVDAQAPGYQKGRPGGERAQARIYGDGARRRRSEESRTSIGQPAPRWVRQAGAAGIKMEDVVPDAPELA